MELSIEIVSAMPVDDKPVVLVGDKPVEVKPLLDERKNIAACSIVSVDKGVQTDAPYADRVSVQMPQRMEDYRFVRKHVRHFVGAAVRMHKGKDGHFVSCVAWALLIFCRVVQRRFMFSNARFQQGLRRRRWRRLSTSSFGEEKRCSHPGLYQVE
jgi:hypothetical protein